jgi:hypothetical protein
MGLQGIKSGDQGSFRRDLLDPDGNNIEAACMG